MYGNLRQNVLNSTLYLNNASNMNYVCLDAMQNIYVWVMYKYNLFNMDFTQVMLGGLQNVLGNILTIQKIYSTIVTFNANNETAKMYFQLGRIYRITTDFMPIVVDNSGYDEDEEDGVYFQHLSNSSSLNLTNKFSQNITFKYNGQYQTL